MVVQNHLGGRSKDIHTLEVVLPLLLLPLGCPLLLLLDWIAPASLLIHVSQHLFLLCSARHVLRRSLKGLLSFVRVEVRNQVLLRNGVLHLVDYGLVVGKVPRSLLNLYSLQLFLHPWNLLGVNGSNLPKDASFRLVSESIESLNCLDCHLSFLRRQELKTLL